MQRFECQFWYKFEKDCTKLKIKNIIKVNKLRNKL